MQDLVQFSNFEPPAHKKTLNMGPKKSLQELEKLKSNQLMGIPNSMKTPQYLMSEKDRKELTAARNHQTGISNNSKLSPISSQNKVYMPSTANFYDKSEKEPILSQ